MIGVTNLDESAVVEPADAIAQASHQGGVVAHEHDRGAVLAQPMHVIHASALELLVADGDDFVDEQDLGVDVDGDGEACLLYTSDAADE